MDKIAVELNIPNQPETNYNCSICKDVGMVRSNSDDYEYEDCDSDTLEPIYLKRCKCEVMRQFDYKLSKSGLSHITDYSFSNFITKFDWQKKYLEAAKKFRLNPTKMFFMSGPTGSGKTRLSSTLFKYLVYEGKDGLYMQWEYEMAKVADNYRSVDISDYDVWKRIPILYIDDFLKSIGNRIDKITDAELRIARSLINDRYKLPNSITLISTELTHEQIGSIDASLLGRIQEMTADKEYLIVMGDSNRDVRQMMFKGEWENNETKT